MEHGRNIEALTANALDHYLFSLARMEDIRRDGPMIFVEGKGLEVNDASGKRYLDMMSMQTRATSLGFANEEIAKAIYDQLCRLHYAGCFSHVNDTAIQLSVEISKRAPKGMTHCVYGCSGSEANELAFKLAKQYQHFSGKKPRAYKIIARWDAYHGATMGAQAATDSLGTRHANEPGVPGYSHIPAPINYRNPFGMEQRKYYDFCIDYLERQIQHEGPDYVAAFIGEPVMQTSGAQVPPDDYWPRVREICDKYGVLLIADEVICGFGRTGQWFAMQNWGVVPDIITFAKAVTAGYFPLGGAIVKQEIADALPQFLHVQTYQGHPGGTAAALKTIEIIERDKLIENARVNGAYFLDKMKRLENLAIVGETRGLGMWTAIDFTSDKKTRAPLKVEQVAKIAKRIRQHGVLSGHTMYGIEFAPGLIATKAQLDKCVDVAEQSIKEIMKEDGLG
ncbi:MAG: aspartate aminotransferase family protein [Alphaproteobacteria bacterium]